MLTGKERPLYKIACLAWEFNINAFDKNPDHSEERVKNDVDIDNQLFFTNYTLLEIIEPVQEIVFKIYMIFGLEAKNDL
jgi:hypothetical protein